MLLCILMVGESPAGEGDLSQNVYYSFHLLLELINTHTTSNLSVTNRQSMQFTAQQPTAVMQVRMRAQ